MKQADRQTPPKYLFCATWDEYAKAMFALIDPPLHQWFIWWRRSNDANRELLETDPNAAIAAFMAAVRSGAPRIPPLAAAVRQCRQFRRRR
jgi:hypothetical protein